MEKKNSLCIIALLDLNKFNVIKFGRPVPQTFSDSSSKNRRKDSHSSDS